MAYNKEWYRNNRERVYKINKKWYDKKRKYIGDYKLSKGCQICGYNNYASALCFHHPNDNKKLGVGSRINNVSFKDIKEEIKKCIVLCANCHAELHEKILKMEFYERG